MAAHRTTAVCTIVGGVVSPLLANIYLHYALDLWVAQWRRREARRHVRLVWYADDYLLLFEDRADALRMLAALPDRLAKFGLSLHEGKTRLVEFGRFLLLASGVLGWVIRPRRRRA